MAKRIFDDAHLAAVKRVLDTGNLSYVTGVAAPEFEAKVRERLGCKYALAIHSAMAGLQMALMTIGVGEGDEVICDPIVPFGAKAVPYQHARPVFAAVPPLLSSSRPLPGPAISCRHRTGCRQKVRQRVRHPGHPPPRLVPGPFACTRSVRRP